MLLLAPVSKALREKMRLIFSCECIMNFHKNVFDWLFFSPWKKEVFHPFSPRKISLSTNIIYVDIYKKSFQFNQSNFQKKINQSSTQGDLIFRGMYQSAGLQSSLCIFITSTHEILNLRGLPHQLMNKIWDVYCAHIVLH